MRWRLIIVALAVASLTTIAFLVPLALLVRELAHDRAITDAERDAQLVAVFVTAAGDDPTALDGIVGPGRISGRDLSIVFAPDPTADDSDDASRVVGAPIADEEDLTTAFSGSAGRQSVPGGEAVYAPAIRPDGTVVVRVLVPDADLTRNVTSAWVALSMLGLGLIAISVVIADRMGRNFVRPIEELSAAATRLGGGDLTTRVEPNGPKEISEVGAEFNRLAEQVARLLEMERETAADLSHRLRTPLAALNLDAGRLPPGPMREQILDGLAELERAVDSVIREIRRPGRHEAAPVIDIAPIIETRAAFWEALAEEQHRPITLHPGPHPCPVQIQPDDLEAAVDAVIGNIFSHTAEGVGYEIRWEQSDGSTLVIIDDAGPGMGDEPPGRGRSGGGSTGLGLDITRNIVETAGGTLTLGRSHLGGTRVQLDLGPT